VLISGALVIQLVRIGWVCWYRLRFVVGVGRRMSGVRVGWAHCWVLRKRACCLSRVLEGLAVGRGCLALGVVVGFLVGLVFCHTGSGCGGWAWRFGRWVRLLWLGCLVVGWAGCCLLFVNCIVDASIFVAKFFRAHGGCLGIRSR
jgi:hypothetical protein